MQTGRAYRMRLSLQNIYQNCETREDAELKLKEFWSLLFELIGSVYYRWGAPEEAEKFFYGNARRLRSQIGGGGLNGKEESNG